MSRNKSNDMEKLSNCKFQVLSVEQMNSIDGGGWRIDKTDVGWDPIFSNYRTSVIMQRYNIWGNATGEYHVNYDAVQ